MSILFTFFTDLGQCFKLNNKSSLTWEICFLILLYEVSIFSFFHYCNNVGTDCSLPLPDLVNGNITCTNATDVSSTCHYSCSSGYKINLTNGLATRTCELINGTAMWSGSAPTCTRKNNGVFFPLTFSHLLLKVAATSLKLEIRLHVHQLGANATIWDTEVILRSSHLADAIRTSYRLLFA